MLIKGVPLESQPLSSRVPLTDEEFEASEPLGTRTDSSHSSASSDSTAPLSPDHLLTHVSPTLTPTRVSFYRRTARMVMRTQPTLSPGMSACITETTALPPSSFRKRYRSSYETPSPSSSLTLMVRKRYKGTSELILDTNSEEYEVGDGDTKEDEEDESSHTDDERESPGLDDEGQGLDDEGQGLEDDGPGMEEEEEVALEGQQQAILVVDTATSEPLGLGYRAASRRALESTEEIAPSTYEVGQSSSFTIIPVVPSPIASLVATLTATISVDEDQFLEVEAQLELYGSILYDHTQILDALPPALFADINRDVRELYTRSGAVRDEIFSQRYRFRSLEQEQERVAMTFGALWRPVLALEEWARQTDAQRVALWHAIYDVQRENHDLRMQIAEERRERL
ncbi:hypothetical protein Tco_1027965 [Tanacetum coccineum]